ncbi:protein IQ-DOMAIN 1 isoform X2 [Cajanus cajan]|uniref:Protein IQ-DOMAIN 1 n=2 Tax=Cajanus cajan TaxID=3821 RepID=A0A151U653_CAJCA|nr:protein IQ-DOMAIN 1 isoform X2 [Cajanus cajan]XP_029126350.1 protein IQ-DOMAIN 1 isoform X2 [Cajanus cajan]KYP74759.1 Protein IQ-DOMAIN 1 [Cajanus cajan]
MGRKGWFSAVKKVFISDSKKEQKHHHHNRSNSGLNSKFACFGVHHHEDLENAPERRPIAVVPSLPPRKEIKVRSETERENEQSNQAFSLVLATAVAAGAAVAAAAEVARLSNTPRANGKMNREAAAIKIQTAYRGYLARRSLRGLRGLARLRSLVQGQSVQRQAASTLQSMQTLSRLQSQIRARKIKMSEENQTLQRQLQQKREKEYDKLQSTQIGEKWDDSIKSKEEVEAKLVQRQIAAMRREKALAYASTHQQTWKNSSKSAANATFMDPNNPHWGWNWLERWMAARPWEGQNITYQNSHASTKVASSNNMSVGEITKLYSLRDQNQDLKTSPASQKPTRPPSHNSPSTTAPKAPPSTNGTKAKTPSSPKGGSWGGDGDSHSMFNKVSENNRRHSIGVSPLRDDESHSSSSCRTTPSSSTKIAKPKPSSTTKVRSASFGVQRNGTTPEKPASSAPLKKRLSFPASSSISAGSRRHSISTRPGNVAPNKNVAIATIPEEKVKVKNGGSR